MFCLGYKKNNFQQESGLEVIKLFYAQPNWAWNSNCSYKLKYQQIKKFLALSLSDGVFFMLAPTTLSSYLDPISFPFDFKLSKNGFYYKEQL